MDILITLFYILFCVCVIYPPTEFVSAGFTIPQLFDNYLGSENGNFIAYHKKRITLTAFIHSLLPLGYIFSLWCGGVQSEWLTSLASLTASLPLLMCYRFVCWLENHEVKHPAVKSLSPYVLEGQDWRVIAPDINRQFWGVDKVSITLSATSKLIATEHWLIKVTQYGLNFISQRDCSLVATGTDRYSLTTTGEDEVQYINLETVSNGSRPGVEEFSFRISTAALRDLQTRLSAPVRVPEHISLLPTLIERFVAVFKQHVNQNTIYYTDQEMEQCIGCMQATADVKIMRQCLPPPEHVEGGPEQCQPCNCRVLWCCGCVARWWAARARGEAARWLAGRASCPVCRAVFCLRDVLPARARSASDRPH